VAAGVNPGEQVDDHVAGFGDVALASDIVEVAAEVGEGREAAAGFDEALDDVGGFVGVPVVSHGFGDAAEFDDGELASEFAHEGVDAATDFGEGHGVASQLSESGFSGLEDYQDCVGWWGFLGKPAHFRSFPVI